VCNSLAGSGRLQDGFDPVGRAGWRKMTIAATSTREWSIVLGLSLGPAVGNGFARFGYGLLLPAMRLDLAWSYTEAGWISTANAIGYLIGAVLALRFVATVGAARLFRWGMLATVVAICAAGTTRNVWLLALWRITAGLGGAPVFIAGGAMVARSFDANPARNALAIALYFCGSGFGMAVSGALVPSLLERFGAGAWIWAWWTLGLTSAIALPYALWASRRATDAAFHVADTAPLPWPMMLPSLVAYFLFASGYIVYVTFLVAWMRERGAEAGTISLVWIVLGLAVMASPFPWRPVLAAYDGGGPLSLAILATAFGALLPVVARGVAALIASAVMFGFAFFIAPSAAMGFTRKNLPPPAWGPGIALYTTVFAVGQTLGPIGAGWIADVSHSLTVGMISAGVILTAGSLCAAGQAPLGSAPRGQAR